MSGPTLTTPFSITIPGACSRSERSTSWPSASTSESASSVSNSPVGCGKAGLVELHLLDRHRAALDRLDGREPFHRHAFLQRLLELEIMRRHFLARAAIDDDRLGRAETAGGAGGVERGVAAAVDDDLAAEQRRRLALHRAQQADGVEDLGRAAGRDIGALGDMGADGEERRVIAALAHRRLRCRRPWR